MYSKFICAVLILECTLIYKQVANGSVIANATKFLTSSPAQNLAKGPKAILKSPNKSIGKNMMPNTGKPIGKNILSQYNLKSVEDVTNNTPIASVKNVLTASLQGIGNNPLDTWPLQYKPLPLRFNDNAQPNDTGMFGTLKTPYTSRMPINSGPNFPY